MGFFQVDDDFWSNVKVRGMVAEEGFGKASQAGFLWVLAGSRCRKGGLDGVIGMAELVMLTADRPAVKRAAALLVEYGLWHADGHSCARGCPQPGPDAWVFHQWFQYRYATGEAERLKKDKMAELRNPVIVEAVWARDTAPDGVARCRYCGVVVVRPETGKHGGRRKGPDVGQLDHVDPNLAVGATNIALSCPPCNRTKSQRLPAQAGMTMRPPPAQTRAIENADQDGIKFGIKSGSSEIKQKSSSEVSPPRARARGGAGGVMVGLSSSGSPGVPVGLAGVAPVVAVPALWVSPWKDHHGAPPAPEVIAQATCPDHGYPMPCLACADLPYDVGRVLDDGPAQRERRATGAGRGADPAPREGVRPATGPSDDPAPLPAEGSSRRRGATGAGRGADPAPREGVRPATGPSDDPAPLPAEGSSRRRGRRGRGGGSVGSSPPTSPARPARPTLPDDGGPR